MKHPNFLIVINDYIENHLFRHTVSDNQIQGLSDKDSRTMSVFKDFLGVTAEVLQASIR